MTREWLLAVLERAVKTAAQVAVLAILASGVTTGQGDQIGFDVATVDWAAVARFAAGGAILSVLTSLASGWIGERGTPSLTRAESVATDEPQELPQTLHTGQTGIPDLPDPDPLP